MASCSTPESLSGKNTQKQLIKASALYKHMKIEVSGTAIIKKACFE